MITKTIIAWLCIILGTLFGLLFSALVVALYRDYLSCTYGETCFEMLTGPAVFALLSAPCWAMSSLGVFLLGDTVNKSIRMISFFTCGFMFLAACYFLTVL